MPEKTLYDFSPPQLEQLLKDRKEPAYRGRQLAAALYKRAVETMDSITDFPLRLRRELDEEFGIPSPEILESTKGEDGSEKVLFSLSDGARIESVGIPMGSGKTTFCISSQVGCRMGCRFCATSKMGRIRQLRCGEILAQVIQLKRRWKLENHPNLVFMGMGEPLDNFEELAQALEILTHPEGLGISARKITVSTSGLVEGIRRLSGLDKPYGLAISLTVADEHLRKELMPVAGNTSLEELMSAAADHGRRWGRKVTLECVLIRGVNDRPEDARRLLQLASRGPFKVNLIPLNPVDSYPGERPDRESVDRFADLLWQGGIVATVRDSAGRQVGAACGQLLHKQRKKGPA